MKTLQANQLAFSGVDRTLAGDYVENIAFAGPGSYVAPNMNTYNSANGYFKVCASWVMKVARANKIT